MKLAIASIRVSSTTRANVPVAISQLPANDGKRTDNVFATISNHRLKRGVFRSIVDLQAAINRFLHETNDDPKPYSWTADLAKIIAAEKRGHQVLDSIH